MSASAAVTLLMKLVSVRSNVAFPGTSDNMMSPKAAAVLFCTVAVLWWVFDRIVKAMVDVHELGEVFVSNVLGLFEFKLVHNTGAAWGVLSNSTFVLGVFSCIVCVIIVLYVFALRRGRMHAVECLGLSLVFSGGLGNAFDRLTQGYVVDFINTTFMSFPVFNIADIGVTCGIVLFLLAFFIHDRKLNRGDE